MAIADLLVCIDPTTAGEARLKLALNLARAHKAHLGACYIMPEERGALIGTGIAGAPVIPAAGMVGIAETLSPAAAFFPSSINGPNRWPRSIRSKFIRNWSQRIQARISHCRQ